MLYAHGSDLCHDSELRHAMANCFEALMGALFLDGGINVLKHFNPTTHNCEESVSIFIVCFKQEADRVFGGTLYGDNPELHNLWTNYSRHPLQIEEPVGDRHWVESHNALQRLTEFEGRIGVEFTHIRLLARAFTDRSLGYNNLSR
jgi:ribonuclease-3